MGKSFKNNFMGMKIIAEIFIQEKQMRYFCRIEIGCTL